MDRFKALGRTVAPPRFLLFAAVFVIGLAATMVPFGAGVGAGLGTGRGIMAAFDAAAAVFLLAVAPLARGDDPARMRIAARTNDANRAVLLAFTAITLVAILVSVAEELGGHGRPAVALVLATLVLAWTFSNVVYALHYAHLFYLDAGGADAGGLDFPGTAEPDYRDFLYFSMTLGMTFQTSDVTVTSRAMRRVVLGQSLAAFVFNLGVLAFTVNVLGG